MIAAETDENRLRLEADAKSIEHPALDACGKSQHITCRCATTVDQGEGMFGRDPNRAVAVTAAEPGPLDQPCCLLGSTDCGVF